jgi:hypothetical protein
MRLLALHIPDKIVNCFLELLILAVNFNRGIIKKQSLLLVLPQGFHCLPTKVRMGDQLARYFHIASTGLGYCGEIGTKHCTFEAVH